MNLKKMTAAALTAFLLAAPAMADEHSSGDQQWDTDARYEFKVEPGQTMIFREPVSFTGEVTNTTSYDRTIKAANGMTIRVPNEALLWNGDRDVFAQTTNIGDNVVVHMRAEEPYRLMQSPLAIDMNTPGDMLAIGSYDGVYWVSKSFINDLALDQLDNDIYANANSDQPYDEDLASVKHDNHWDD